MKRVPPTYETVEHVYSIKNVTELKKFIDTNNIDVNENINGKPSSTTMAHYFLLGRYYEQVKILIEYGIDVEKVENKGMTILHRAITSGNVDFVSFILSVGANLHAVSYDGKGAFDYAIHSLDEGMITFILDMGAKIPAVLPEYTVKTDHELQQSIQYTNMYALLVLCREVAFRQSACALWVYCKCSKFHALRGILKELILQMKRMRGGDGCGPRAHGWG